MRSVFDPTAFGRTIEPMAPQDVLFRFRGRIARRTWWLYGVAGLLLVGGLGSVVLRIAGLSATHADSVMNLLLLWPALAISVKRWHDRDKSAWWVLVALLPVIGWAWAVIENGLLPGTRGANRYGTDPRHSHRGDLHRSGPDAGGLNTAR